ncbi:MAG TPA: TetR family transcriptional regulator [Acidimicrobiales bacterium]|nr:TetR family transcriptional regulator [Acidimicrobiales bacterium]
MASPPAGLRERKKERTRAEIERVAMQLFVERGFDAVTVDEIGAAAEVSHRTFYRYFASKEDVVLHDIREMLDDVRAAFAQRPASEPVIESIRAVTLQLAATYEHDGDDDRKRVELLLATPSLQHRRQEQHVLLEAALVPLIAERLSADPSRDMRPALIAACAGAAIRVATDAWIASDRTRPLAPTVDEAFSLLIAGLR